MCLYIVSDVGAVAAVCLYIVSDVGAVTAVCLYIVSEVGPVGAVCLYIVGDVGGGGRRVSVLGGSGRVVNSLDVCPASVSYTHLTLPTKDCV